MISETGSYMWTHGPSPEEIQQFENDVATFRCRKYEPPSCLSDGDMATSCAELSGILNHEMCKLHSNPSLTWDVSQLRWSGEEETGNPATANVNVLGGPAAEHAKEFTYGDAVSWLKQQRGDAGPVIQQTPTDRMRHHELLPTSASVHSLDALLHLATGEYSAQRNAKSKGKPFEESHRFYKGTTATGDRDVLIAEARLRSGKSDNTHFTRVTIQGFPPLNSSNSGLMHPFGVCDGGSVDDAFNSLPHCRPIQPDQQPHAGGVY